MKTSELKGALLDYWVARAEGYDPDPEKEQLVFHVDGTRRIAWHEGDPPDSLYDPSKRWMWGGPIIDREQISTWKYDNVYGGAFPQKQWFATAGGVHGWDDGSIACRVEMTGETALIAAMRAYVASKFGEEVPDDAD